MRKTTRLSASEQLTPHRDLIKAGIKPFRLTLVFDYVEIEEHHPYGSTTAVEHRSEMENDEYFKDGVGVPHQELAAHLEQYFDTDLDELAEKLVDKAVIEFYKT